MPQKQMENEYQTLKTRINQLDKWNIFRERRSKVITKYIYAIKRMRKAERLVIMMETSRILRRLKMEIQEINLEIHRERSKKFVALMIAKQWKKRYLKFNSSDAALRNRVRYSFTKFGRATYIAKCHEATKILEWTFSVGLRMITKNRNLFRSVYFMQEQHANRQISLVAKREILDNFWFKMLGQLNMANAHVRSNKMTDLLSDIQSVSTEIRQEVLTEFILTCQQLHKIAFYQWRRKSDKPNIDKDMLTENIEKEMMHIYESDKLKNYEIRNQPDYTSECDE